MFCTEIWLVFKLHMDGVYRKCVGGVFCALHLYAGVFSKLSHLIAFFFFFLVLCCGDFAGTDMNDNDYNLFYISTLTPNWLL